ncbi:helix-turn-helix domain-containing protein [Macrococcoides bohemicum]|uniref:Helix-turn-helix domain-containing protein n=1 Tax=Macrococcoides bohemicum TaxID=1903056 RepID=A0AAJ4PAB9_9STAP|nr:helix-turn-helix transcriptional regulator [Macrococcus bohemicus]QYA42093.1 helix-turn-helix domain-containing protein [Macrococcus bohemicus]
MKTKLNELMKAKDVSQTKICEDTGITRPTIKKILDGKGSSIGIGKYLLLCDYFDVDLNEMFFVTGDKEKENLRREGYFQAIKVLENSIEDDLPF